jgi:molybdenum cofactor cytidylyltransferase
MDGVAAIVLAAGRSRRMGAFKPLLPFGNTTIIDSCIANLRAGGADDIVVVVGHRAEDIRQHLADSDVSFAVNEDPDSEMSVSISFGVRALPDTSRAVLILPVDHPAFTNEVTHSLIRGWQQGAKLVVPEYQRRGGHPVLIDFDFRDELQHLPEGGLRSLFETHKDQVLRRPVECPYIARDMDTWDDYSSLHKEIFGTFPELPEPSRARAE